MSNTKHINDGGPAFPCLPPNANPNAYAHFPSGMGMTLRDWFAGQALNGILAHSTQISPNDAANWSLQFADALIATRSQKP